jgi:hypothetical protein
MKLGLLADIHEEVEYLRRAIEAVRSAGAERLVMLGDVFETGKRLDETVALLAAAGAGGVWGNHDFGLCREVGETARQLVSPAALGYFAQLQPQLEIDGCLFKHIEPYLDAENLLDLWSYGGAGRLDLPRSFASVPHRRIFMGHLHRWQLATPAEVLPWNGSGPVHLDEQTRYLVVMHAVQQGWCAVFDTVRGELMPIRLA